MNAAEVFVRCLENEATPFIFGVPGEENLDVTDALLDSSFRRAMNKVRHSCAMCRGD